MRLPPLPWFTAPALVLSGLIIGGLVYFSGEHVAADVVWGATLVIGSLPMFWEMLKALRRGHFGIDIIAIVAIASSIVLHQYMAGIVILLMLSGGEALEIFALRRARKDLTSLINNAPTQAHKQLEGSLIDVPVDAVVPGDTIIVKPGESVPVDGQVLKGRSMVDESKLTGEPIPVEKREGSNVMSGSICQDGVLTVRVLRASHESKYEQILRLVRDAEEKKAPFVRLADRYSVWFTSATFILAAVAWFLSNDPVRVLAVLVVATPCPLILATPIAFAAGISRAAKRGIIVKNGGALEKLGTARCFVFDKTGTLTLGIPAVLRVEQFHSTPAEVLHIAASLDQLSTHVLARALIRHARSQNVSLAYPDDFSERFGDGVMGTIDGKKYMLGRLSFLEEHGLRIDPAIAKEHEGARERGEIAVYLGSDTQILGAVFFSDIVRDNVRGLFDGLHHLGIQKIVMLTGDKKNVALKLGKAVGIPEEDIYAEALPDGKVRTVTGLRKNFAPVVMVGDGVNDAPAIAVADVGIAMGSHGSTASSEAGDVVILLEKIERVGEAMCIGHAVLRIAKESIFIGIGLSLVLMVLASMGFILPVIGALLQEIIDVIVILNALRTLFVKVGCGMRAV